MVQNATDGLPARGRPPSFDRPAVIDAALRAFWPAGAGGTTVADLERATGVDRSSLYNSFGGKGGLHRAAAEAYVGRVEAGLFAPLRDGDRGVTDIEAFLDRLAGMLASAETPAGCFIVNSMGRGDRDAHATARYLDGLREALSAAVSRAVDHGELDADGAADLASALVAGVLGANLIASTAGASAAGDHLASLARLLRM
ncbi:TetR/AcrR family transcriptional regulator [Euzebya tangerina]|uniref:TetR/AcrR family transcriptional regulator n=1 Tax=Euzebya tangerina TaxID=591198 RepID=UPI000E30FB61|nr:TetR/AcrR family transcriptional regulator [Euzebya tangerina]